jgi:FkbM family methyltransferase
MEYQGQWLQDQYLDEFVFKNKNNGVFVEIGSADPVHFSNSYFLETYRNWSGLLIDARKGACDNLISRKSKILNVAIADSESKSIFLEFGVLSGIAKFMDKHEYETIEKYTEDFSKVNAYWVNVRPLSSIIKENSISIIDLLMIDTEGAEYAILQSSYESLTSVKILMTESNNDSNRNKVKTFLSNNNFVHLKQIGMDDVFLNLNYKNEFLHLFEN